MTREQATIVRAHALNAIMELNRLLLIDCQYDAYDQIKKGVGISIMYIDDNILRHIYSLYPDLDHIEK